MQTDYYQRQNLENQSYLNQSQTLNSTYNNSLNNSYNSYQNSILSQRNQRYINNYTNLNNTPNTHIRGLSQDIENKIINNPNSNNNYNPYTSNLNWQKLKDQILSPGDNENYSNNYYYQNNNNYNNNNNNYQNIKSYTPLYSNNIKYYRSSSSEKLHYNTINTSLNNNIILPKEGKNGKKTLILDLDETLVHSAFKPFFINKPFNIISNIINIT